MKDNDQKRTRITFNMSGAFTWELYKNLKFKTEFGYDTYKVDTKRFFGPTTYYVKNVPASANQGLPAITLTNQYRTKFRNTNTVSYDFKDIFGKNSAHSLNVLLGEEYIIMKNELMTNTVSLQTLLQQKLGSLQLRELLLKSMTSMILMIY